MAEVKVSQEVLMNGFLEVFRNVGYEGASLNELARATGLKKSSLYHRFPEGKQQMAREVLEHVGSRMRKDIVNVLLGDADKVKRLNTAVRHLDDLYASGKNACILRTLSMETGLELFSGLIRKSFEDFVRGFEKLAMDFDYPKHEAREVAESILIMVQGSLIVTKAMDNSRYFQRSLIDIKNLFLE